MTDAELDQSYTALCASLAEVGRSRSELFLSMVALGLIARCKDAGEVLDVIERVRQRCLHEDDGHGR